MKPLVLIILDGWGISLETENNGIALARKPNFDHYFSHFPHTMLHASGPAVGLPKGVIGNSEVGHINLGAGRIVYTGLSQIYHAIEDGSFRKNEALLKAIHSSRENGATLHLMGLLSDGAVHSHQDHLFALLDLAQENHLSRVMIHCFMDGRDTPPREGIRYIFNLEEQIRKKKIGQIASVMGRFYAMDRDRRWDRIKKAHDVLTGWDRSGEKSAQSVVHKSYQDGIGDEFIIPHAVLDDQGQAVGPIGTGDAVIFFNFRADRARQLTHVLTDDSFSDFERKIFPKLSCFICMAPYDESLSLPIAYTPTFPDQIFPHVISQKGLSQLRVAETEKYAHVTYFFNGGRDRVFDGEERLLIPSARDVPTYDLKPEMSALKITSAVIERIEKDIYHVLILNFANPDMVGHTANPKAIVQAIEVVDECLKKIVTLVLKKGGQVVITADHGNAEEMRDERGAPHTAHTLNPVPFVIVSEELKDAKLKQRGGRLCDVAPTLLDLLKIKKPKEMTGESLIVSN